MCGVFGVAGYHQKPGSVKEKKALNSIAHRGPDDSGEWTDSRIFAGHQRLSILDLSANGRQPMVSDRCVITVNGEIYNYRQLKQELAKHYSFVSDSDSEVILHGYSEWGIKGLLSRLEGMYAIAIYDRQTQEVWLVRDRVGIKPLYYACTDVGLIWASELCAIEHYLDLSESDYDSEALLDFVTYRYIPSPKTLYRGVNKLPAGNVLHYRINEHQIKEEAYWQPPFTEQTTTTSTEELLFAFDSLLSDSLSMQTVSDVPLGGFLSGGIDSALLIAKLKEMGQRVPTFSIGFSDSSYDESPLISCTAQHLRVENQIQNVTTNDIQSLGLGIRDWFCEPYADFSAYPTYLLCQHARQSAVVALSGDGADELFLGYPRFCSARLFSERRNAQSSHFLGQLKRLLGWTIAGRACRLIESKMTPRGWDAYCMALGGVLPNESRMLAEKLEVPADYDPYWLFETHWDPALDALDAMRRFEFLTLLPDMLLAKTDRVSMRNSLEVRVPYLATAIVDFAFRAPAGVMLGVNETKPLLRNLASSRVPKAVSGAKKRGFGLPPSLRLDHNGKRCSVQHKVLVEEFNMRELEKILR